MHRIIPFLIALQFLTRIPVSLNAAPSAKQIGQSVLYYPVVGLVIGIILVLLSSLLSDTDELLRAALILTIWIFITGALHFDGLADSADAMVGGFGDREKTLRIMKDPNCGPIAVVTLVAILLIQFTALAAIPSSEYLVLLLIPVIGRSTVLLLFLTTPYIQKNGIANTAVSHYQKKTAIGILIFITILLVLLLDGAQSLAAITGTCLTLFIARKIMMKRLGGMTGDTIGATIVMTEAVLLITFAI